jgi:hypothetical protein
MKYEEIIGLHEYFQPVYDITQEPKNYWKQFIPTKSFLEVLEKFLSSLESKVSNNRKSIWLQGTYGTGKSHATGVIKHLLWDDFSEIEDFIKNIDNAELRERLKNFRKGNRVLPVTLKGVSGINTSKDFSLTIEKAVKESLEKFNISVLVDTEFDKYLKSLEDTKVNWKDIIDRNQTLKSFVGDIYGLKRKLQQRDPQIIKITEEALGDLKISHPNIENWLSEVLKSLKEQGITHIGIYWDEFTPLMELSVSSILLSILQNIAEKSFNENIFLFIISHRHPQQTQIAKEDQEKVLGRFKNISYYMENITTFHIISKAINRKNEEELEKLRESIYNGNLALQKLMMKLVQNNIELARVLKKLFPIHPYTAQIAVGLARYIGSTERSIFSFLYNEEKGFKNFIKNYPDESNEYFLTVDKLWDYFMDDLERRQEDRMQAILSKYNIHFNSLKNKGEEYLAIFKGILILNIISSIITSTEEVTIYSPSKENIEDMFLGTHYQKFIDQVLEYIDKNNIIPKTPDGLYLISQTPLPIEEINREKEIAKREYEDITKLISDDTQKSLLTNFKNGLLRELNLQIYWAGLSDNEISRKINKDFINSYKINIALFLAKKKEEMPNIKHNIKKIIKDNLKAQSIIFIISYREFGEEKFDRLLEYIARKRVAQNHSFTEEAQNNDKYISTMIKSWLENLEKDLVEILFRDKEEKIHFTAIYDKINKNYSKDIFNIGLENIERLTINKNLWTPKNSQKYAEIFLTAEDRYYIEQELKSQLEKPLLEILKSQNGEYIVDKYFKFNNNADPDHPTYKIFKEVEKKMKELEGKNFNLGEVLEFLREPPYGIYPNMIHYALLGFILRPYTNKLYEEGTGRKLIPTIMIDRIKDIFNYLTDGKDKNKLNVRLGTQEEVELTEILKDLFGLEEAENLNKAKWGIREWIRKVNLPIWSLKYLSSQNEHIKVGINTIEFLNRSVDRELNEETIKKFINLFKNIKTDLKLILKKEKIEEGFKNWLLNHLKEVEVEENHIKDIIDYLHKNMQEEVALWEENNVLLKLKDLEKEIEKNRYKREFINKLSSLFNFKDINNFQDLRENIKIYVNNNLRYPLWSVSYILNISDAKNTINFLEEFIRNPKDLNQEEIKKFLELFKANESLIYHNLNLAEKGIQEWLKANDKTLNNDDIYNFLTFLRENIDKEVYLWEEKDLKNYLTFYKLLIQLADLFNIDKSNIKNLENIKQKIKYQITNYNYPFWAISLNKDEDIKRAVNKIIYIITSNTTNNHLLEDINNTYQTIKNSIEKVKEIWESSQLENLYKEWLKDILNIKEDVSKIIDAIKIKMRNEDYFWDKSKVENHILREKDILISILYNEKKEKIIQKIKTTNKDLRDILLKLIDIYPQIIPNLEDLL